MIDWHSHILPNIDDGSKNVAESNELLKLLSAQGVTTVVASPHFYPNQQRVHSFIERRQHAYEELCKSLAPNTPDILLGAEVYYYSGISRMEDLQLLRLQNSKVIMLEMPMAKWSDYTIREVIEIAGAREFTVLIAHIDRYMSYQSTKALEQLLGNGILIQANASFFQGFVNQRKALRLLNEGFIHVIGSDCHNMEHRPPKIGYAFDIIQKKLGEQFLQSVDAYGRALLCK